MKFTLNKEQRIRRSNEFRYVLKQGRRFRSAHFSVIVFIRHHGRARLGLTVSRKVGNAVVRNRVKRRLRELIRLEQGHFVRPFDMVIIAQPDAGPLTTLEIRSELHPVLEELIRFVGNSSRNSSANSGGTYGRKPSTAPTECRDSPAILRSSR